MNNRNVYYFPNRRRSAVSVEDSPEAIGTLTVEVLSALIDRDGYYPGIDFDIGAECACFDCGTRASRPSIARLLNPNDQIGMSPKSHWGFGLPCLE